MDVNQDVHLIVYLHIKFILWSVCQAVTSNAKMDVNQDVHHPNNLLETDIQNTNLQNIICLLIIQIRKIIMNLPGMTWLENSTVHLIKYGKVSAGQVFKPLTITVTKTNVTYT